MATSRPNSSQAVRERHRPEHARHEIQDKQLDLLRELVQGIGRVAFLFNMDNPVMRPQWKEAETAARSLHMESPWCSRRRATRTNPRDSYGDRDLENPEGVNAAGSGCSRSPTLCPPELQAHADLRDAQAILPSFVLILC
jgi:hypothetical protein